MRSNNFLDHVSILVSGVSTTICSSFLTGGNGGITGKSSSSAPSNDVDSSFFSSTVDIGFIDCALACAMSITITKSVSFSSESKSLA